MATPFLGQILIVGFNFAPFGWATCNGQLIPISQNTALFSILGTFYGGNGTSTFALPNLQAATPLHAGQGIGLSPYSLGETGGVPTVILTSSQVAPHTHQLFGDGSASSSGTPASNEVLAVTRGAKPGAVDVYGPATHLTPMDGSSITPTGGNLAHNNRQPYLALTFVIALQGVFPARN